MDVAKDAESLVLHQQLAVPAPPGPPTGLGKVSPGWQHFASLHLLSRLRARWMRWPHMPVTTEDGLLVVKTQKG